MFKIAEGSCPAEENASGLLLGRAPGTSVTGQDTPEWRPAQSPGAGITGPWRGLWGDGEAKSQECIYA